VADLDELPEGRVKTVAAGHRSLALTHFDGRYGALENRCPHQGGPLGEGTIEKDVAAQPVVRGVRGDLGGARDPR
jgi:pyruvate oxidase